MVRSQKWIILELRGNCTEFQGMLACECAVLTVLFLWFLRGTLIGIEKGEVFYRLWSIVVNTAVTDVLLTRDSTRLKEHLYYLHVVLKLHLVQCFYELKTRETCRHSFCNTYFPYPHVFSTLHYFSLMQ